MSGFATRADLRTGILRWLERESETEAGDRVDDWIALAETDMGQRLRAPWMVQVAALYLDEPFEELPPRFLQMHTVLALNAGSWRALQPIAAAHLPDKLGEVGFPQWYCIEGQSITAVPMQRPVDLRLTYYGIDEPLVIPTASNLTLERAPNIYLYGALRHAAIYYSDDAGLARWNQGYELALKGANDQAMEWASGGGIVSVMPSRRRRAWR